MRADRSSRNAKLAAFEDYFARDSHRRHITQVEPRWDPIAAFFWLIVLPLATVLGWWGFWKLLLAFLRWTA